METLAFEALPLLGAKLKKIGVDFSLLTSSWYGPVSESVPESCARVMRLSHMPVPLPACVLVNACAAVRSGVLQCYSEHARMPWQVPVHLRR
jgi:hypothetical protein